VTAGHGTPEDGLESLRLVWPAYFADPENTWPMPPVRLSVETHSGVIAEVTTGTDEVAAALATGRVPYGIVAGAGSPMPWGQAAHATADLSPRAFLTTTDPRPTDRAMAFISGSIFLSLAGELLAIRAGQDAAHGVIEPSGPSHARLLVQAGVG
jgi:hypothetical protein